ncbi:hypothetical protein ACFVYP_31580 [Kitasatospora sp. NPDC058201]|uniref:hypothetical protein n=1 Tax=unclassified Kitasatospora TaxID=2633591 RepID=UPI00364D1F85
MITRIGHDSAHGRRRQLTRTRTKPQLNAAQGDTQSRNVHIRELADQGLTVTLITHRLAATADADLIYVLHEGRLTEQGSHAELMADPDGRYRASYLLQAAQYATAVPHRRSGAHDQDEPAPDPA